MIRIVTSFKPFDGEFGPIQRAAIESWRRFSDAEITVLGDEEYGAREAAREFSLAIVPTRALETAHDLGLGYGAPLLSTIVWWADTLTNERDVILWLNADLVFTHNVDRVLEHVFARWPDPFVIGRRRNVKHLTDVGHGAGALLTPDGADVFAWRHGFFPRHEIEVPPYILGRFAWDQWLIDVALRHGHDPVDPSEVLHVCHPEHSYRHLSGADRDARLATANEISGGHVACPSKAHNFRLSPESHAVSMRDERWVRLRPSDLPS